MARIDGKPIKYDQDGTPVNLGKTTPKPTKDKARKRETRVSQPESDPEIVAAIDSVRTNLDDAENALLALGDSILELRRIWKAKTGAMIQDLTLSKLIERRYSPQRLGQIADVASYFPKEIRPDGATLEQMKVGRSENIKRRADALPIEKLSLIIKDSKNADVVRESIRLIPLGHRKLDQKEYSNYRISAIYKWEQINKTGGSDFGDQTIELKYRDKATIPINDASEYLNGQMRLIKHMICCQMIETVKEIARKTNAAQANGVIQDGDIAWSKHSADYARNVGSIIREYWHKDAKEDVALSRDRSLDDSLKNIAKKLIDSIFCENEDGNE